MKPKRLPVVVLTLLLLTAAGWWGYATLWGYIALANAPTATAEPPQVVRIYYDTLDDLLQLQEYDVWEINNLREKYVLAAVSEASIPGIEAMGFRVMVDEAKTAVFRQDLRSQPFNNGYRTVAELYSDLEAANAAHPTLTELVTYGQSHCQIQGNCVTPNGDTIPGHDLRALRITNEAIPGGSVISGTQIISSTKPVLFVMANIHAREITTPELAMRLADWLLDGYGTDPDATWLVDWHEIWIVPSANPDGHWLVELGTQPPYNGNPLNQRKNANRDANNDGVPDCNAWPPSDGSQFGVDLNRNHSFGWGPPGSSANPCSLIYRGPRPASEVEISQLEAFVASIIPDQRGPKFTDVAPADTQGIFITLHSYSRLVLWPWGFTSTAAPNKAGLEAIGDKLATYNGYLSCQPTTCLYGANGTSDDWAYAQLGVPAFTFEIGSSFMPPYDQIDSEQWPANGPALQYAAKIARAPYQQAFGPDITAVSTHTPTLTLHATLSDANNGGQPIAAAAYTVDTPFWAEGAAPQPLQADDGAFDEVVEETTAVYDPTTLTPGRHLVFLHAQDSAGNWGAVSAVFLDVAETVPRYRQYLPLISKN